MFKSELTEQVIDYIASFWSHKKHLNVTRNTIPSDLIKLILEYSKNHIPIFDYYDKKNMKITELSNRNKFTISGKPLLNSYGLFRSLVAVCSKPASCGDKFRVKFTKSDLRSAFCVGTFVCMRA